MSARLTYLGIFCVAAASLQLEILLTRVVSVISWYHLAFFVISLAMLGMTAGAIFVFLRSDEFEGEAVGRQMSRWAMIFALATPVASALALALPLSPIREFMDFLGLLTFGSLLALPFAASGVVLTLALTRSGLPPAKSYGVDLIGAALGCAAVIPLLAWADAPTAILVASALAGVGAAALARAAGLSMLPSGWVVAGLLALAFANRVPAHEHAPLRPIWVKGDREDPEDIAWTRWNTYSRVTVSPEFQSPPVLWAPNPRIPDEVRAPLANRTMQIDGAAATVVAEDATRLEAHRYLDYDVTSFAHRLRPTGPAAVIGVGGGRDLLAARVAGHPTVVGVELNSLIVELHRGEMRPFSRLVDLEGVELVADEARSWFARNDRDFSVIAMSLIDTWASTGAGAYSLSENGLYTVEAWTIFLDRLETGGIFTVSRWWKPESPGETGRMIGLAFETLWRRGVDDPRRHVIVIQGGPVATLLMSPAPFSDADLDRMQSEAVRLGFNMVATPRRPPSNPQLAELWDLKDSDALAHWSGQQTLDLSPSTDDRPFFFNMLRPSAWLMDSATIDAMDKSFLGNLRATQTLVYTTVASLLLTLLTIVWPLRKRGPSLPSIPRADMLAACAYFGLIGLGFMFVEIGLLSRLNVLLGHPTLSMAVLLGGIIFFTGVGSLLSDRAPLERSGFASWFPLIPFAVTALAAVASGAALGAFADASTAVRIVVGLGLVALPALGMGLGFPLGLRLAGRLDPDPSRPSLGPWLWGINGAFGVCASGLALGSSMTWGVPVTLALGAGAYLALLACTHRLARTAR